jgi:hypothetical protein
MVETVTAVDTFVTWWRAHPMPDKQALARRYNGLAWVPVAEWLKHSRALVAWRKTALAKLDALATMPTTRSCGRLRELLKQLMKEHPHASGDELQRLFMEKVRDDEDAKHAMLKWVFGDIRHTHKH